MKTTTTTTIIVMVVGLGPCVVFAGEKPILAALAMIESGNNPRAIGRKGERSAYQIMPSVWKQHSKVPFVIATKQPEIALDVVESHAIWLANTFKQEQPMGSHRTINNIDFYIMWNRGFTYYKRCEFDPAKISPKTREKAVRYQNLVMLYSGRN